MGERAEHGCHHPDEAAFHRRFADRHRREADVRVVEELDRAVCGVDYACTGWTDLDEARSMAADLELAPGVSLLEVGTGAGWPGLFVARSSGCTATLTDRPLTGLRRARGRAAADGLDGRCRVVAADGGRLPFADQSFDAVLHTDVLCCLPAKSEVLRECRRVTGSPGRMVFSVISVVDGLDAKAHAEAVAAGPTFVESVASYPELLAKAGWRVERTTDVTTHWRAHIDRRLEHLERLGDRLEAACGADGLSDKRRSSRAYRSAVDAGMLRRRIHVAVAG